MSVEETQVPVEEPLIEQPAKSQAAPDEIVTAEDVPQTNGVHDEGSEEIEEQGDAAEKMPADEEISEQTAVGPPVEGEPSTEEAVEEPESTAPASEQPDEADSVPAAASAEAAPKTELPIWRKRLWFVRMPKPLEEPVNLASEHEMESYRTQVAILNESLNVKRMDRDAAAEQTQTAQQAFNLVREQYEAKRAEAEPHRARRKELREAANQLQDQFKSEYGDLPARTEAELDQMVGDLHHRMQHDTMPLNEEKKCLATIKKLEAAREKVREYGIKASAVREARTAAAGASGGTEELEAEVQALFDEMDTQRDILVRYRTEEKAVRAELQRIQDERSRVKALQDEAYNRLVGARNDKRDRNRSWGDNRRFSQQIRQVLARGEGALEEARAACNKQMQEAIELLGSDAAFRAEYFKLWEGQRKGPTSPYSDMDAPEEKPAAGKRKGGKGAAAADEPQQEDAKTRAEALIAAALAQASETVERANRQRAEAEAAARAAAAKQSPADGAERSGEGALSSASAAAAAALGNAPTAPKPTKTRRASSKPLPPVVVPDIISDNFELPSAALKQQTPVDAEDAKQRMREHNRAAAADAERRKDRQRKAAEEKRRAAEARRQKEALAKLQSPAASDSPVESDTDVAAAAPAPGEAGVTAPAAAAVTSGDEAPPSAAATTSSASQRPGKGGKPRVALPREPPRARAPAKKRNPVMRGLHKTSARLESTVDAAVAMACARAKPVWDQYPVHCGVGAIALVVVLLAFVYTRL